MSYRVGLQQIGTGDSTIQSEQRDLYNLEVAEEERLQNEAEADLAYDEDFDRDKEPYWLQGCGWPRWFHYKSLPLLASATRILPRCHSHDLLLGEWHSIECISPAAHE